VEVILCFPLVVVKTLKEVIAGARVKTPVPVLIDKVLSVLFSNPA